MPHTQPRKRCPACGRTLPARCFARNVSNDGGLADECRACCSRRYYARAKRTPRVPAALTPGELLAEALSRAALEGRGGEEPYAALARWLAGGAQAL